MGNSKNDVTVRRFIECCNRLESELLLISCVMKMYEFSISRVCDEFVCCKEL